MSKVSIGAFRDTICSVERLNYIPAVWQVRGIHGRPHKWETATEFVKQHINPPQYAIESQLLAIARNAGCAPDFTIEPATMAIRLRKHERLPDWLANATAIEKAFMRRRVLDQIRRLHRAGVCHRDLKAPDIVLDRGTPLLIDFELGSKVDPDGGCFDLRGPWVSGIPAPKVHAFFGWHDGVWWGSPIGGLHTDFGPLTEQERL
jgi:hypothetical protein